MRRQRSFPIPIPSFIAPASITLTSSIRCSSFVCRSRPPPVAPSEYACMVSNEFPEGESIRQDAQPDYGGVGNINATENRELEHRSSTDQSDTIEEPPQIDNRLLIAGATLLFVLAGSSVAAAKGALSSDGLVQLASWFETLGPNAIVLYSGLYFLLELIGVPALPLTLGSGYLFGVLEGTVAVSISSTLAATAAFVIARYWLRDSVAKLAQRFPRFRAMDRAIGKEGFKFVLLLRLSPLLPFSISNYLYGLTSVNLPSYVAGSWLGMLPGTIAYVSAGAAVGALTDLSAGKSTVNPVVLVIGVVATIAALTTIGKMAAEAIEADDEEALQP